MTSWRDSLLFVVNTRIQIRLMLQGKARSTLERAEEEARRVSEFAPGSLPDVGLTLLSARWLTLLAVLRDANSDLLLHASVLSCLAASGYALADLSRAFLQLHPLFTSSLYIVVAAAYLVDSVIYVLSWQGNALPPGRVAALGDWTNVAGSALFVVTAFLYTAENSPDVIRVVILIEFVANGIFLISALCYLFSWLVTDKLSRGCKLTNVEMWANLCNVLPSSLYIFSSLGTAWFHFTALPMPADARLLALAVAAPALEVDGGVLGASGTANSSSELRLLSGLNVFADALNVAGALFYLASYYRDARSVARECAAAEDAVAAAERAAETVGLASASALNAAHPTDGGRGFHLAFEKSVRELHRSASDAELRLKGVAVTPATDAAVPLVIRASAPVAMLASFAGSLAHNKQTGRSVPVSAATGSAIHAANTGDALHIGRGYYAAARHHEHHLLHPHLHERLPHVATANLRSGAEANERHLPRARQHARHFSQPLHRRLSEELHDGISAALADVTASVMRALLKTGVDRNGGSSNMSASTAPDSAGGGPQNIENVHMELHSASLTRSSSPRTGEAAATSCSIANFASSEGGGGGGSERQYPPHANSGDQGEVVRVPIKLMRLRDAIVERSRTRFAEVLGASLSASQHGGGAFAVHSVLRSLSMGGAPRVAAAESHPRRAHVLHPRQHSHGNVHVHDLTDRHLHSTNAHMSTCRADWGCSKSAAMGKVTLRMQGASLGDPADEASALGAGAITVCSVNDKRQSSSACGIDLPKLGVAVQATKVPDVQIASGGLNAPLLAAYMDAPAAVSAAADSAGTGGDAVSEASLGRVQVLGYLGYFNNLDEFEGYQPCGCLYPFFSRVAPAYWQFVTAR